MSYPRVVRAVVHIEAKVLDLAEEKQFFCEVGDYTKLMLDSVLLDRVEIVDQVVVMKPRPTEDAKTNTRVHELRKGSYHDVH